MFIFFLSVISYLSKELGNRKESRQASCTLWIYFVGSLASNAWAIFPAQAPCQSIGFYCLVRCTYYGCISQCVTLQSKGPLRKTNSVSKISPCHKYFSSDKCLLCGNALALLGFACGWSTPHPSPRPHTSGSSGLYLLHFPQSFRRSDLCTQWLVQCSSLL